MSFDQATLGVWQVNFFVQVLRPLHLLPPDTLSQNDSGVYQRERGIMLLQCVCMFVRHDPLSCQNG